NWQVGFAGTITVPGSGGFGFWGWCDFAGGTGSPATSGTDADCQVSTYFHSSSGNFQVKESIMGTAWGEGPCTLPPCLTSTDFYITDGTMTLTGPAAGQIIAIAGPLLVSAGCTITGSTITCPLSVWEVVPPGCIPGGSPTLPACIYAPDTGIPTTPGHYNANSLVSFFGAKGEFQVQVNQLS
ncbi:MAG TPA: hypothetical protein VGR53_10800, partial [Nitrososphaerales archaeon]|nr:hypothetical protein [Nitrososphaerales archaeon]